MKKASVVSTGSLRLKTKELWKRLIIFGKDFGIDSLKFWITIVCVIGFVYQIWDATEEYLEYRTTATTKTNYKLQKFTMIPAITFCVNSFFDLDKISTDFPDFNPHPRKRALANSSSDKRGLRFRHIYKFLNRSMTDFSLKHSFAYSIDIIKLISECQLNNDSRRDNCTDSVSIDVLLDYRKCQTLRTHLTNESVINSISDRLTTIGSIQFNIVFNEHNPLYKDNPLELEVAIHSPYELPVYPNHFVQVRRQQLLSLRYSTKQLRLLPEPYDSDCYHYSEDRSMKSKHDCTVMCEQSRMRAVCRHCVPDLNEIRLDLLRDSDNLCTDQQLCSTFDLDMKNCTSSFSCGMETLNDNYFECSYRCRPECHKVEFAYTATSKRLDEDPNSSVIIIEPKVGPTVFVKYKPSVSKTNFVANIGGIGSFWLGLTVLEVYRMATDLFNFALNKVKQVGLSRPEIKITRYYY